MVSPLQTWEYQEPKRLWPVLGGLAVLWHIGILGLSLPYIIELMQASGDGAGYSVAPIELVVVDPDEASEEALAEPSELPLSSAEAQSATTADSSTNNEEGDRTGDSAGQIEAAADSLPSSVGQPTNQTMSQTVAQYKSQNGQNAGNTPGTAPATQTQGVSGSSAQSVANNNAGSNTGGTGNGGSAISGDGGDGNDGGDGDGGDSGNRNDGNDGGVGSSTAIGSGRNLPAAQSGSATTTATATYLSIGDPQEVPEALRRDATDTPPIPKSESLANSILLSLDGLDCGTVDFSQSGATYKLFISEAGTVLNATLWTGGQATGREGEADAIACLIEKAGFEFEPATLDGEAVQNDNLLVTVRVDEATGSAGSSSSSSSSQ